MKFYFLYLRAWIRGFRYRWPNQGPTPHGYSGVSCALKGFKEVRDMYEQGWIPYCFQRTKPYGVARLFIVLDDGCICSRRGSRCTDCPLCAERFEQWKADQDIGASYYEYSEAPLEAVVAGSQSDDDLPF